MAVSYDSDSDDDVVQAVVPIKKKAIGKLGTSFEARAKTNGSSDTNGKGRTAPKGAAIQFMSKSARERQEKFKEKKKEAEDKKKQEALNDKRRQFLRDEDRDGRGGRRADREAERAARQEEERRRREEKKDGGDEEGKTEGESKTNSALAEMDLLDLKKIGQGSRTAEKETEAIKREYLGLNKKVVQMQKPSEKFRNIFNFEWDASEDTQRGDHNPLYTNKCEPQLLFGRGYRAGIDVREQNKANDFYKKLVDKRVERDVDNVMQKPALGNESKSAKMRSIDAGDDPSRQIHWTSKDLSDMTSRDWRIFREDHEIVLRGGRVPNPMRVWNEGPLVPELLAMIADLGWEKPFPIQMQALPIACEFRDCIGIAQTGSGKTAAYMLPLLQYLRTLPALDNETAADGPYSVVLAPSRELAQQIMDETSKFSKFMEHIRTVVVVGGKNAEQQAYAMRRGAEIIIATPGRLCDALDKGYTVLNQCNYVILDEADRMIDEGFEDYVNRILQAIPNTNMKSEREDEALKQELAAKAGHRRFRITQMFTATMPVAVERMARKYLRAPAYISIGEVGSGKKDIEQRVMVISESQKKKQLETILADSEPPIIVFVNMKKAVDYLTKSLNDQGYKAIALHGGKSQEAREDNLQKFKEGQYDLLIATDVAGRGIDVEGVKQVINFDMPKNIENYTHRIGRTGRAGMKGIATSFCTPDDADLFYDLKNFLESSKQLVPLEISKHPKSKVKPGTADKFGPKVVYANGF